MEKMVFVIVIKDYSKIPLVNFGTKCQNVITNFLTIEAFKDGKIWLDELIAAYALLMPYLNLNEGEISSNLKTKIKGIRNNVAWAYKNVALYAELYCRGNEQLAIDAGFEIKKKSIPNGQPLAPAEFELTTAKLKSGQVRLQYSSSKGAAGYYVEYWEKGETVKQSVTFPSTRSAIISGLTPGVEYLFRVCAVGRKHYGNSPWKGPLSIIVQ